MNRRHFLEPPRSGGAVAASAFAAAAGLRRAARTGTSPPTGPG